MAENAVDAVTARVEAHAGPMLERLGMELVEAQFRREGQGWVLRLFIDREGGVTVDDCATASRELDDWLEAEDFIDYAYTLEVSSPGLERPLKRDADFIRFAGRRVRVRLRRDEGRGKVVFGELVGLAEDGRIVLDVEGVRVELDRDNVARARLHLD